jgi:glycosyltransferase involved in cell wall biosynthesis
MTDPQAVNGTAHGATVDNRDVWLVIPVYNEEPVIADVIRDARTVFPNVVGVDDGSRDSSAERIRAGGAHLVRHPVNLGQGAALQTGISYALRQPGARYIVTFDADGQHRVDDAERLVAAVRAGEADVALGTRFVGDVQHIPWIKRVILKAVVALSPAARKLRLSDAHNGLRAFNREAASRLRITMNNMAHASEIVAFLANSKLRVVELPVTIQYTEYSRSKGQSVINGVNISFDLLFRQRRG